MEIFRDALVYSDGTDLSESTKLRAASRSTLKPNDERYCIRGSENIMVHGSEKSIKHAAFAFRIIPIDFLIT